MHTHTDTTFIQYHTMYIESKSSALCGATPPVQFSLPFALPVWCQCGRSQPSSRQCRCRRSWQRQRRIVLGSRSFSEASCTHWCLIVAHSCASVTHSSNYFLMALGSSMRLSGFLVLPPCLNSLITCWQSCLNIVTISLCCLSRQVLIMSVLFVVLCRLLALFLYH